VEVVVDADLFHGGDKLVFSGRGVNYFLKKQFLDDFRQSVFGFVFILKDTLSIVKACPQTSIVSAI
jgi:hypothetical protein